jgi:hypothetical protein
LNALLIPLQGRFEELVAFGGLGDDAGEAAELSDAGGDDG